MIPDYAKMKKEIAILPVIPLKAHFWFWLAKLDLMK